MNSSIFSVDCITSKENSTIVKIAKLRDKKYRNIEKMFLLDGVKLFEEAMSFSKGINTIILSEEVNFPAQITEQIKTCQKNGTKIVCVSENVFAKLSEEDAPQGIICVCDFLDNEQSFTNVENEKILICESVRDPGNIGTLLRSCVAFGVSCVVLSTDCADIYSSKVLRATMGAVFKVKIIISSNLKEVVKVLKKAGRRVIATTLGEHSLILGKDKISSKDVFVLGNEGHGISPELCSVCSDTLTIPMCKNTESLNVSVAGSIILWEIYQ